MIKRIDHVSIAVKNLDETLALYKNAFGITPTVIEAVPDQGIRAALIPIGNTEIEIIEPVDPNCAVARAIEKRGEGLHHICFEVDDVNAELQSLAGKGVELVDKKGRPGLAGLIGFVHPKSTRGVLTELAQKVPGKKHN